MADLNPANPVTGFPSVGVPTPGATVGDFPTAGDFPDLSAIAESIVAEGLNPKNLTKLQVTMQQAQTESGKDMLEILWATLGFMVSKGAGAILSIMNAGESQFDQLGQLALDGLFGDGGTSGGKAKGAAGTVADKMLKLVSPTGEIQPGDENAKKYLNVIAHQAIEGWLQGWIFELVSGFVPILDAPLQSFGDLDNTIADVMGLSRLTRRVLGPLLDASTITPLEWHVNKTYRQTLLSPASAIRQFYRGKWDWPDVEEELARQGYSSERINALLNEGRKFLGASDLRALQSRGVWSNEEVLQHLRDQGYTDAIATALLRIEGIRELEQVEDQEASAIIGAYVNGAIDRGQMAAMLATAVQSDTHRALLLELADVRAAVSVRHLSSNQAEQCAKAGILSVADYRQALAREGYDQQAIVALELLLRREIDRDKSIEQHRLELEAEREAERLERERAAAERKQQLELERALRRRGSLADLERAVVRGLILVARYAEVLTPQYDADTVAILVELVEQDRQAYLVEQERRAAALKRAEFRRIDVGALEQAVLNNILTLQEFRARLAQLDFDPGDADILTATLAARKKDLDDARAKRGQADTAARNRQIDLDRFEQLVSRGARTIAQYETLLASLGFDEPSRAAIVELLKIRIDEAARARQIREDEATRRDVKGLTLEQIRRGVILELATIDDFQRYLIANNFTTDAQILLLAELRADVAEADAARRRREQPAPVVDARELPLARIARAARLGIVPPDTYRARLERAGYSADDLEIEMELLVFEIADVQAARQTEADADQATPAGELALSQLAGAVRRGLKHLEDYRARAIALGLSVDAVATLVRVLGDELLTAADAETRRDPVAAQLAAAGGSLAELEGAVRAGELSIAAFVDHLVERGIAAVDAELLAAVLEDALGS